MSLDPLAKRFLAMTAAGTARVTKDVSTAARRESLVKLMQFAAADNLTKIAIDGFLPGASSPIPFRFYIPSYVEAQVSPGLLFMHGGGFVAGSIETHDVICRALAEESGCRILSIDYRLAPEFPFPAAIEDAMAATSWMFENAERLAIDTNKIGISGDSAGATLAAIVSQEFGLLDRVPRIKLQCLICPVLDFAQDWPSRREFASGFLIDAETLAADFADYCSSSVRKDDPLISPLQGISFRHLPRTIIHTAECDPLRDEGNSYAERLSASNVDVLHHCHPGMVHNFHALGKILPQGRAVLKQIGLQIRNSMAEG